MITLLLTSMLILIPPLPALKCNFHIDSNKNYICELSNAAPNEQTFTHAIDGYDDANVTIITSMIEENSTLPTLDDFLMRKFANLRKIEVSFLQIKEVTLNAFEVCENIEEISLNRNDLSELPLGVFKSCKNLKIFKLSSNLFTKIPVDGFEGLEGLEVLILDNNPLIEVMYDDFRHLTGLKVVFMSEVGIRSFNVGNFEVIELRNNKFESFEVINAPNLKSLNLSRNLLKSLAFSGPSNLTELDLSMNSLTNLPKTTFKSLINLKSLKLSWNPISLDFYSKFFEGLENLEILELKSCMIRDISGVTFFMQENLQDLDLSHNNIEQLPYIFTFRNSGNLKVLKISSNSIQEIQSTTFVKLTSLTVLDLSHNLINKIHNNSFKFMENLEKLNLGSNRIQILYLNMFPGKNSKLAVLDLSYNFITAIEPGFEVQNFQFLGTDNPCIAESQGEGLEVCYQNYKQLELAEVSTTTTTEATTETNPETFEFSLKDLLFTLVCILFIAIVLIFIAFYINGILNLFGVYEKPVVKDDGASSVSYQKF